MGLLPACENVTVVYRRYRYLIIVGTFRHFGIFRVITPARGRCLRSSVPPSVGHVFHLRLLLPLFLLLLCFFTSWPAYKCQSAESIYDLTPRQRPLSTMDRTKRITNKSGNLVVRGDQFVFLFMSNERLMEEITKEELSRCKKV